MSHYPAYFSRCDLCSRLITVDGLEPVRSVHEGLRGPRPDDRRRIDRRVHGDCGCCDRPMASGAGQAGRVVSRADPVIRRVLRWSPALLALWLAVFVVWHWGDPRDVWMMAVSNLLLLCGAAVCAWLLIQTLENR